MSTVIGRVGIWGDSRVLPNQCQSLAQANGMVQTVDYIEC